MTQHSTDETPKATGLPAIPHKEPATGTTSLDVAQEKHKNALKPFFKLLGPGLITGASDDDPSGIGTYTSTGASQGYTLLWTALITFPLMTVVQYICAKVGMVSGRGLAGVLKQHYSRYILYPVVIGLLFANVVNAGADLGATAAAINLLVPAPTWLLLPLIAAVILGLQIWGSYKIIANVFRWLTLALFAYVAAVFLARPDGLAILRGTFIPIIHWDKTFLATLVAIFGTTISPYLFFWQSDQEVEEQISKGRVHLKQRQKTTNKELTFAGWDVVVGMLVSNLVMYSIILATAATLFKTGKHDVQTATDAAQALQPLAGPAARWLFAIGIIGSGCLAIPVLTGSAAYALSEAMGWQFGLNRKLSRAKHFYAIIVIETIVALLLNFFGINPIAALFWAAVINGILAPPLLVLLMLVANNKKIMRERTNTTWLNIGGWTTTIIMFAAAIAFFLTIGG